ncbi:hypothetical protein TRAPUB_2902 [Trametes pubescens]|uniref:Uncharacterized protein n=1 Tax=Trametes pubescens TaxID=154538 RepID=A0A1M2VF08_TRAPU|nr:hypothetical protein TRAPUB_2902 [Trametes pubescens]
MKFLNVLPAIGALVFGALSVVAQDAAVIITGISQVTDASRDLNTIVSKVTVANAQVQAVKIAPALLSIGNTCRQLTKTITVVRALRLLPEHPTGRHDVLTRLSLQKDPVVFGNEVALNVVNVLTTFVQVHQ